MSKIIEVNTVGGDMIDIHLDNGNILLLSVAVLLADELFAGLREDDRILYPHTDGDGISWRDGPRLKWEEIIELLSSGKSKEAKGDTIMDYKLNTWMKDLQPFIGDVDIRTMKIPATHDSGSYVATAIPGVQNQGADIHVQLHNGARMFDIRVTYDYSRTGISKSPYVMHHEGCIPWTLFGGGQELVDAVYQIKAFIEANSSEVVFVNLNSGSGSAIQSDRQRNDVKLIFYNNLQDHMLPANGASQLIPNTLNGIIANGKRLIVMTSDLDCSFTTIEGKVIRNYFWNTGHLIAGTYNFEQGVDNSRPMDYKRDHLEGWVKEGLDRIGPAYMSGSSWHLWSIDIRDAALNYAQPAFYEFLKKPENERYKNETNFVELDFINEQVARKVIELNLTNGGK